MDVSLPYPSLPPGARRNLARNGALVAVGIAAALAAALAWPEAVVLVESTPNGADVTLDGRAVGQTPLRLATRPWPLSGRLQVKLEGYEVWQEELNVAPGVSLGETAVLEPLPASVTVSSTPSGALVRLDQREVGSTPLTIGGLPAGDHEVAIDLPGYQHWQTQLQLAPGASSASEAALEPLPPKPSPGAITGPAAPSNPPDSVVAATTVPPASEARLPTSAGLDPGFPAIAPPHAGERRPVAVMIENSIDARPQSGLLAADIVFEALTEGGISRFMAVYFGDESPVVGPVRSARHYFVNLAAEFGAALVHIGSSPQGYQAIHELGTNSLDETFGQPGFWRSRARLAPHNAYTSLQGARHALSDRGLWPDGSWSGFTFKAPTNSYAGQPATHISIRYQPWDYVVEYRHNSASNLYARFMAGAAHREAESGQPIEATSVAVLRVKSWVIDTVGRLDMDQVGSGAAIYFLDGVAVEGDWRKASPDDVTHFVDRDGQPIRFNPGQVWVQIIPEEGTVSY